MRVRMKYARRGGFLMFGGANPQFFSYFTYWMSTIKGCSYVNGIWCIYNFTHLQIAKVLKLV